MTRTRPLALRRRTAALIPLLVLVAFFASSCFKADIGIQVNDDGSGTVSVLTAFDLALFEQISQSFSDSSATPAPTPSSASANSIFDGIDKSKLPPGAKVEPYSEGKFKGARITAPFKSGADIAALIDQMGAAGSSPESGAVSSGSSKAFEKFSLTKDGGNWIFAATVAPPSTDQSGSDDLITANQLKALFKDASFVIRLKLPGKVTSDNADEHKGGELIWNLDLFAKDARSLSAESESSGGSDFPILPVAGGAALLVLAVVAVVVVMSRRRTPAAAPAGPSAPPPASPLSPVPPPTDPGPPAGSDPPPASPPATD